MDHQIIFGSSVLSNVPGRVTNPMITFPGQAMNGADCFQINEDLMARHILLLGGSGCGKTNALR